MNRPQAFGPYDLTERINVGGMAEVFRAFDRANRRVVALKRILPSVAEDDEFVGMFRDEATIASQLDHPNIARIFDVGRIESSYYLALEFIDGKDLRAIAERTARTGQRVPMDFVLYALMEACQGMEYAHEAKDSRGKPLYVVHRDVSPANILVSYEGDVKIIDFGIAKAAGKVARTQVGTIKGKFGYMSPEQVRGLPIDHRSDVFSLGICLWELLAGERLFSGDNEIIVMEKIRAGEIPPIAGKIPNFTSAWEGLERLVAKALAKDVDERYAKASDLYADLKAFAHAQGIVASRARAAEHMRRLFAGEPAKSAGPEEISLMADNKGGSDLDVFEGLAKRVSNAPPPPGAPGAAPSRTSGGPTVPPPIRQKTLLGLPVANMPPPGPMHAPPPPPRTSVAPPTPTSSIRPRATVPPPMAPPTLQPTARITMPPQVPSRAAPGRPPGPGGLPPANPPHGAVDMDWDDDDEKTAIFDKGTPDPPKRGPAASRTPLPAAGGMFPSPPAQGRTLIGPGAAALVQSSGSAVPGSGPPPPPPRGAASRFPTPPQPPQRTSMPAMPRQPPMMAAPPLREPSRAQSFSELKPKGGNTGRNLLIGSIVAAAAVAAFLLLPGKGKVEVFAAAANGKTLDRVSILVDGVQKCQASPCALELDKGVHAVKAVADGYSSQEQGITVHAGEEAAVNFRLDRSSGGTGLRVAGRQDGVRLFVDGRDAGPLPQELKDLSPGDHKILFKGSDRYAPEERVVSINSDEVKDLGTVSLKVVRGLVTFDLRTSGAKVTLVSGSDRRQLADFSQPVEIETSKSWTIEATKTGFSDYRQPITFEDRAEKTYVIALSESGGGAAVGGGYASAPPARQTSAPVAAAPVDRPAKPAADTGGGGECTLNFNSIPVSNVVLDGRPIGGTPRLGVTVPSGSHSVTFINPDLGKKSTGVTCKAGDTKTVAMRLNN